MENLTEEFTDYSPRDDDDFRDYLIEFIKEAYRKDKIDLERIKNQISKAKINNLEIDGLLSKMKTVVLSDGCVNAIEPYLNKIEEDIVEQRERFNVNNLGVDINE